MRNPDSETPIHMLIFGFQAPAKNFDQAEAIDTCVYMCIRGEFEATNNLNGCQKIHQILIPKLREANKNRVGLPKNGVVDPMESCLFYISCGHKKAVFLR